MYTFYFINNILLYTIISHTYYFTNHTFMILYLNHYYNLIHRRYNYIYNFITDDILLYYCIAPIPYYY